MFGTPQPRSGLVGGGWGKWGGPPAPGCLAGNPGAPKSASSRGRRWGGFPTEKGKGPEAKPQGHWGQYWVPKTPHSHTPAWASQSEDLPLPKTQPHFTGGSRNVTSDYTATANNMEQPRPVTVDTGH